MESTECKVAVDCWYFRTTVNDRSLQNAQFTLGQGQVIKGWDEGLQGMVSQCLCDNFDYPSPAIITVVTVLVSLLRMNLSAMVKLRFAGSVRGRRSR